MKKVININFQGRVVPIEESSFEILKQYTDSLRNYFANEEGRDEIINDIESRIGELFQDRIKNGATCITDDDINTIINNMGRPQDFAAADDSQDNQQKYTGTHSTGSQGSTFTTGTTHKRLYRDENHRVLGGVCSGIAAYFNIEPIIVRLVFIFSGIGFFAYLLLWAFIPSSDQVYNGVRKRLYRNPDDKVIAGVCSGIASYFNINVWIPRILFLIPFISIFFRWGHFGPLNFPNFVSFSFSPGTILLYIILWLVIPEASTTSEKLEMKGEKVDLNSIKNSVVEEMKGVKERVEKIGKEARSFAQQHGSALGTEMGYAARRTRRSLGDIIIILLKIFLYFWLGIFALMIFGFAIAATGIFPFKDYLLTDGWQNWMAWGSLLFLIYVPVIGIITWLIRRIARIKSNSKPMRFGFVVLLLIGIFCFVSLLGSLGRDFKSINSAPSEQVTLTNPGVKRLDVVGIGNHFRSFRIQPFAPFDEDTMYLNNVSIRISRSSNDSFQVTVTKFCAGSSRHYADTLASVMRYNIEQRDSTLYIDKGIGITEHDKFRNQHVVVTIAVPVGKVIRVDNNVGWGNWEHFQFPWSNNDEDYDWGNQDYNWWNHHNEDLIMKADGLYTIDGDPVDVHHKQIKTRNRRYLNNEDNDIPSTPDPAGTYRYEQTQKKIDSLQVIKDRQMNKLKDSLEKAKEQIDNKLQKIQDGTQQEAFTHRDDRQDFVLVI